MCRHWRSLYSSTRSGGTRSPFALRGLWGVSSSFGKRLEDKIYLLTGQVFAIEMPGFQPEDGMSMGIQCGFSIAQDFNLFIDI